MLGGFSSCSSKFCDFWYRRARFSSLSKVHSVMSDVSELLLVLQSPAFHNRRALYIFILRNEAISNGIWRWGAGRQHTTAANVQNRAINSSGQCFGSVPGCHAARARKSGKVLPISVVTQAPKWVAHARAHNIFRQEYPFHSRR